MDGARVESKAGGEMEEGTHPLVSTFPPRVQLLGEVPQVVIVVEVEQGHQILQEKKNKVREGKDSQTSTQKVN